MKIVIHKLYEFLQSLFLSSFFFIFLMHSFLIIGKFFMKKN
ncbi:hypothetical protein PU02_0558 [Bartonella ancashensis]|uniref:Uncharacterized protein n=1 Tax=Bartonella ancashensis TaxID=1318743 RepID=A0A0M4LSG8_9HYPH|nr:hypothetical protein PU02_0558 [Bartonella ancashensis]